VAQHTLKAFTGDLADYQQWLKESLKAQSADSKSSNTQSNNETKVDKKQQRQQEANKRETLKPLTNRLKKLDKELEQQQKKLADIEKKLTDDTLYGSEHKGTLKELLQEQGQHRNNIEALEEEWLEIHEDIENLQS